MKTRSFVGFSASVLFFFALPGCNEQKPQPEKREAPAPARQAETAAPAAKPAPTGMKVDSAKVELFGALPASAASKSNPDSEDKAKLGKMLFHETRLSKDGKTSCNSCHDLRTFGTDGKEFSVGALGKPLSRNTPGLYDAALEFVQFADGREETIEAATKAMLLDPAAMGRKDADVVSLLESIPEYAAAFKAAFPDDEHAVTIDNTVKALAVFQRRLVVPSRWDKFAAGDQSALTEDEKKGFLKFVEVGCPTCHLGPLVGATMYQKLGKEKPWPSSTDKGRSQVTKSASDDMMFKVSSLRNVERTAPYFHDASAKTLDEAVKKMAEHQLGKTLSDADATAIVTWLATLTAAPPDALAQAPELPASTKPSAKPGK